jgi:hypothetical protein
MSPYEEFIARVDEAAATRTAEITDVTTRIRVGSGSDGDDEIDDQIADLKDEVATRCANAVSDGEAENAIDTACASFTDDVSNASLERRVAALLTVMDAAEIGA